MKLYGTLIERPRKGGQASQRHRRMNGTKKVRHEQTKASSEKGGGRKIGNKAKPQKGHNPARLGAELSHLLPAKRTRKKKKKKKQTA